MRFVSPFKSVSTRLVFILACATLASLFFVSSLSRAQQQGDARRRRADTASAPQTPQATPTPAPAATTPRRRIAPELGEPPAPPVLKPKPTPKPNPSGEEIDPESTLRFNTELVTLNVRVIDRNNQPINNLRQDEFRVYEDGALQPIFSFTREEVPIGYGLAVDTSGSLRSQLQQVIDAAKIIINSNKPWDETFLERFISSDKIETVQDFTTSKDALLDGLDTLYIEGGQTAVIDGVYLAAEHVANYKKGKDDDRRRRALVVITDGEDRESYWKENQLMERLREEDVQIFVIGFVNELEREGSFLRKSPREKAINLINKIAKETGGRAFFPQSVSELPDVASTIVRDMRTQYVLSYGPTNKTRDGSYRAIKVAVADGPSHDKRIALTRSGRTAPREGATPSNATRKASASPANNAVRQPAGNGVRKSP